MQSVSVIMYLKKCYGLLLSISPLQKWLVSQLGQKNKFQNKVIEDIMLLKFKDLLPILLIVGVTPIFSSDCLNEIDNTIQTGF